MGRRKKTLPTIEKVSIIDAGSQGKAIAKVQTNNPNYADKEVTVFVTQAVPGDVIDLKITRKKKSYWEGMPVKFHQYSDKRIEAFCKYFGACGGCKWQNLAYTDQLFYKQKQVIDNFQRLGHLNVPEVLPIIPSQKTDFYRNKLEFTFSNLRWLTNAEMQIPDEDKQLDGLGFHVPGRFDKVIDIEKCYLQKDPSNAIRNELKRYALENNLSFFDLRKQTGFLRNLIVRTSTTGELMVIVVFFYEDTENRTNLLKFLQEKFTEITSLFYIINPKKNDSIADLTAKHYSGNDCIYEQMHDLKFKIGPKSFFQTNSEQALLLYEKTKEFARLQSNEIVYDLYTGTGTIANFVAKDCKKVVGIEYIEEAIEDAKINSELNGIDNTVFFAGDMKDILSTDFFAKNNVPDVLITDPPRAGMHKDVIDGILYAKPKRIVYVSCNPATQARDIALLAEKYDLLKIQPVDMFPHTHHVENIALLEKNNL